MALIQPYYGVLVMTWLGYMNPHRLGWGFMHDMPLFQIATIVTFICWIFSSAPKKLPLTSITIAILSFILWTLVTTILAQDPSASYDYLLRYLKALSVVAITLILFKDRDRIHKMIWVIVISIGFYGFKGGIFTLFSGSGGLVWGPVDSFIAGNNELAIALLMVIPFMFVLAKQTNRKWLRYLLYLAMLLSLCSVIGTYSRGAFLALLASGLMLWWRSNKKLLIGSVLLIVTLASLPFIPQQWIDRMSTIQTYEQDQSALGRLNAWGMAYNLAKDRFTGGGFDCWNDDNFSRYAKVPESRAAHSIYFQVLGEHGFVGLAIFLMIFFLSWRKLQRLIRETRQSKKMNWVYQYCYACQISLTAYLVGGAFSNLAYFDLPYHLVVLVALIGCLYDEEYLKIKNKTDEKAKIKWPANA